MEVVAIGIWSSMEVVANSVWPSMEVVATGVWCSMGAGGVAVCWTSVGGTTGPI